MRQSQTANLLKAREVNSNHIRQVPYSKPGWYINYVATGLMGEQQCLISPAREKGVVTAPYPQIQTAKPNMTHQEKKKKG